MQMPSGLHKPTRGCRSKQRDAQRPSKSDANGSTLKTLFQRPPQIQSGKVIVVFVFALARRPKPPY